MIEVKTADLQGAALDWAVAKAEGHSPLLVPISRNGYAVGVILSMDDGPRGFSCQYSTDWAQGGPLIEKHKAQVLPNDWPGGAPWLCWLKIVGMPRPLSMHGETPLVAACRAIVAAHLGCTVRIPAELI